MTATRNTFLSIGNSLNV